MEKVRLPKSIAEAINRFEQYYGNEALFRVEDYVDKDTADAMAYNISVWLRMGNYRTYYTALVNGYEVEMTPEEKVREYYESQLKLKIQGKVTLQDCSDTAIVTILKILGIKISGVNAE